MTAYTPYSYTLAVPSPTSLIIICSGKHAYSGNLTGSNSWSLTISFDGTQVGDVFGAAAITDNPICIATVTNVAAGNHTISVTWTSTSQYMTFQNTEFAILSTFK